MATKRTTKGIGHIPVDDESLVDIESGPLLFEVAWEVCRRVGGIYTVLRSKAAITQELYGDRYCLIGPYAPGSAAMEFEELEPGEILGPTIENLRAAGTQVHYGRWLVTGNPRVLLIDFYAAFPRLNEFRARYWQDCGIHYPDEDSETNDSIAFGYLVAEFFEDLCNRYGGRRQIIAHFHEWLAAAALPIVRRRELPLATVFTTHATLLGRYLCASTTDFYERLPWINPDAEAGERQIYHRYCIERAASTGSHVFTTVSDITALEADHLLKRRPEKVLPNGLRVEKFAALHEFQNMHRQSKERINQFVQGHFFGTYSFDLDKTIYLFTSGRYEYHNKGIDVFIEALSRLNHHLMHAGSETTVVAFIVTAAATRHLNVEVLQAHTMLQELRSSCDEIGNNFRHRLFEIAARGELPESEDLIKPEEMVVLKRLLHTRAKTELPPIVTHHMYDEHSDPVLNHLRHRQLFNNAHDRVKVVFHPEFINRTNPLFRMDYPEFVRGCHLGVFPSYYEPWGYTPAECAVLGIPSVCTDLSGFGAFIQANVLDHEENGIYVLKRRHVDTGAAIDQLTDVLIRFAQMTRRQRIQMRNRVERLSECLDWTELHPAYEEARELALQRAYPVTTQA
ncbi:MAG: glycogen synthase [Phycisphaerales bacterium]|nr:glycogen synthase [Phycisphaerales bacterium]